MNCKDNKIENIVNLFIKQILDLDSLKKSLDDKLKHIDILINNLIDYCIKKKIFYFVENKISYTNITENFKIHLIIFIKNLIDPSNTIIDKYILSNFNQNNCLNFSSVSNFNNNWDNVSDVNSIMFKNFKHLNETFEKNVSFDENLNKDLNSINNYDNLNLINNNTNLYINNESYIDANNLSIYIKILINQNKYIVEFTDKLLVMCKIISDPDIKYKKSNPYD